LVRRISFDSSTGKIPRAAQKSAGSNVVVQRGTHLRVDMAVISRAALALPLRHK
jgi:hypothetical protein